MTEVIIKKCRDKYILTMSGHAGYNPGNDIVCSALSVIEYMLSEWVVLHPEAAVIERCVEEPGYAELVIKVVTRDFNIAAEMAETGFKALFKAYPENVKFFCKNYPYVGGN